MPAERWQEKFLSLVFHRHEISPKEPLLLSEIFVPIIESVNPFCTGIFRRYIIMSYIFMVFISLVCGMLQMVSLECRDEAGQDTFVSADCYIQKLYT
jgi:hypothetical protein